MERVEGVVDAVSGYANGDTANPSYEQVIRGSGHAEAVKVTYDADKTDLDTILKYYLRVIDPTSLNKQGNDRGVQYRSGVYYTDKADKAVIDAALKRIQSQYKQKVVVENKPLDNFYLAEMYHQDYLAKNPNKSLSPENIYSNVWKVEFGDITAVAVYVQRLRKKIEENPNDCKYIKTDFGKGYIFCNE